MALIEYQIRHRRDFKSMQHLSSLPSREQQLLTPARDGDLTIAMEHATAFDSHDAA